MKFSIITPSFNQLPYLKRCLASVRDQAGSADEKKAEIIFRKSNGSSDFCSLASGLQIHHHVQDGGSTDGTVEFLRGYISRQPLIHNYQLTFASQADEGMYDALNKGVTFTLQKQGDEGFPDNRQLTTGNCGDEIVAWLNCDEQYLPGILQRVASSFETHREAGLVYGDVLLVGPEGELLTCRKNPPLRRTYVLADHLYTQSAALFFRAGIFSLELRFDTAWKAVGDADFIIRLLKTGVRSIQIKDYLAACTMTGRNLSYGQTGREELKMFRRQAPALFRLGRLAFNGLRYFEKFLRGGYWQAGPLGYDLYIDNLNVRKRIVSETAGCRFRWDGHD